MKALLTLLVTAALAAASAPAQAQESSATLQKKARVWLDGRRGVEPPEAVRRLLSPAARAAFGLETLEAKRRFAADLRRGKLLVEQQAAGPRLASQAVLSVQFRDRHAVVTARVRAVKGKPRIEETTWVRVQGTYYLRTKHDLQVDRLRTPAQTTARRKARRAAVERALDWLARHQDPSGRWKAVGGKAGPGCASGITGRTGYDVSVTALALTAFARAGFTHRSGEHRAVVARGLKWLRAQRKADGALGFDRAKPGATGTHSASRIYVTGTNGCTVVIRKPPPAGPNVVYHHALGALALATLLEASGDAALREPVGEAVTWILAARNPHLGWGYGVADGRNNTSITLWMLRALAAARRAGVEIPAKAFGGARRWLHRVTDAHGWIGYQSPGGGSSYVGKNDERFADLPTMNAAGLAGRRFCGDPGTDPLLRKGYLILATQPPVWGPKTISFLYWHHGAEAFAQRGWTGGVAWGEALRGALLKKQLTKGCEAGSWRPAGEWCGAGGGIYAAAINSLALLHLPD